MTSLTKKKPCPTEQPSGLCLTCNKFPTCVYPKNSLRPVLFCDEFEGYEDFPPQPVRIISPSRPVVSSDTEDQEDSSLPLLGLCRICERRHECTYPKPEGGVWHCEEYL